MPIPKIPIIAGIAATFIIGGAIAVKLMDTSVQFCDGKNCTTLTKEEYKAVKTNLADKYLTGQEMTWDEYQSFVKLLDTEIKQNGKLEVKDMKSEADIRQAAYELMTK